MVIDGFPNPGTGPMAERLERLRRDHDRYRRATLLEPRGSDVLVGALLCEPQNPAHTAGVIFFNNAGYLGMCGHGTIRLVNDAGSTWVTSSQASSKSSIRRSATVQRHAA